MLLVMIRRGYPVEFSGVAQIDRVAKMLSLKMGATRTLKGKTAMDFTMDAWVYNAERGLTQDYLAVRAVWMLTDAFRSLYGRSRHRTKKVGRLRTYQPIYEVSDVRLTRTDKMPWMDELPDLPRMPRDAQLVFNMLADGLSAKDAAELIGVSPSRISQIVKQWKTPVLEAIRRYTER